MDRFVSGTFSALDLIIWVRSGRFHRILPCTAGIELKFAIIILQLLIVIEIIIALHYKNLVSEEVDKLYTLRRVLSSYIILFALFTMLQVLPCPRDFSSVSYIVSV